MENTIIKKLKKQIVNTKKTIRIGFPDGKDERIVKASKQLTKDFTNVETIIIDQDFIKNHSNKDKIFETFTKARQGKNTEEQLKEWMTIPNYFAMGMLELGEIDCIVGGATTPTADLLRPALQIVKAESRTITSFFWMSKGGENYFLGDPAIIPNPSSDDLITIAKLISNGVESFFDIEPFIAMLSFSTNGSGGNKEEMVNKVRNASNQLAKEDYNVLGETQFDAAWDLKTRNSKWKKEIAERPNIYIFPDLNSGNIGYKIMKLTGNYDANGPIIVGLNKPINDLSRGCDAKEVYTLSLITINMFIGKDKK